MESANKMKLTYTNVNGYLIPNLTYKSGNQMEQLGKYGFLRRDYLKNHRNSTYQVMLLHKTGKSLADDPTFAEAAAPKKSPAVATVYAHLEGMMGWTEFAWSSSDITVASVADDGTVTAGIAGVVTITVTTDDGGYTATCEVTVTDPDLDKPVVEAADSTATLTFPKVPEAARQKRLLQPPTLPSCV